MEELSDAELNALSDEGLQKIANGGKLEDLGDDDLKAIADMQPEDPNQPSWFQENVARPIVDKAADIYGSLSSLSSENIRTEAMNQLLKEGSVTPEEVRSGKVEPGLGNKMAAASEMFLQNAFDVLRVKEGDARTRRTGDVNPQILADMQAMDVMDKSLAEMNVAAMVKGKAFTWGEGNAGILEKLGDTVSTPEQFVARASLGALSGIGALPRKDAIELLSQTQLHGSDLVDYFWIPETAAGKIGRGVLGFAADVAMDPLSYLTFGAGPVLKNIFKEGTVKMGNRVITDPKLLARAERQALLAQNDVVRLIREPGRIQNLEVADEAMNTLSKAVSEKGLQGLDSEIVDRFSRIDPALGEQVASVIRSRQTEKGLLKSLADRETSLNFGFRLPLTNIAIEQQVPLFGHGTRWAAEGALGVKDWAFSSANRVAGSVLAKSEGLQTAAQIGADIGDALSGGYQAMKTFTTRPLWDSSSNKYINKKAGNSNWALRQMDEAVKEVGNDPETAELMVKWLNQMPTHDDTTLLAKYGPAEVRGEVTSGYLPLGVKKQATELTQTRQLADQTMAQLEMKNPKAAQRVRLIREQFNSRVAEMEKRGIPFNVLNPFDETIPVEERAMGYFPHILNPDYIDDAGKPKYSSAMTAWEDHQAEMGLIDRTQVGRADRRSTHTIIDSVKKASGLDKPIFITDPISASYSRIEDMDNIIAQHDLFQEIWPLAVIKRPGGKLGAMSEEYDGPAFKALKASYIDEDPGRGFVKMDWKDYASPVFKKSGGGATMGSGLLGKSLTTDLQAKEYIQFKSFLPPQYKTAIESGASVYFPEDVATRINYVMQREKGGIARQAIDAYGYWFRNSALFGPGYQGMNAFGNLTTHMTARGDLAQIPRASKFLFDAKNNSAKVRGSTYTFGKGAQQISINGEELYDTMAEMGILGGSHTSEADIISDVWDQVATTKSTRDKLKYKAKTLTDRITLFKFNRHLAEQNDNIFRSGLFFDSLEKGYSLEGAKERVGMYFYDFRDMPKGQRAVSKAIPFSSFSMKTLESGVRRAAKLDLTPVTIPHYVGQILDGAFVDSYEERQALKTTLPPYADHYVLGDALPGGRQLLVEAPFVVNSIKSFLNPLDNVHPLIQALAMATTASSQADAPQDPEFEAARLDSETYKSKWDSFLGDQLRQLIPPSIKIPLTIAQMKNPDEVRALPLDFVTPLTAKTFAEASGNTSAAMLTNNAQEFGKFLREHVSPNWFYNALMFGQFKDPYITNKDALGDKDAIFGNFVKSRMRDMSFGLVRMNDMDRAIVTRMAAVQRQILKSTKAMETVNIQANVLRDPLATPKLMKNRLDIGDKKTADLVAELGELYQRNAALSTFYGYYISQQKSGGMAIDMIKNAIQPEKPLTAEEADNQNMLMESAPALEAGRIKSQMLMEGQ